MKVILPKQNVDVYDDRQYDNWPLFFLAGPILGGGDWQYKMAQLIGERCEECFIATPSARYGEGHPLEILHVPVTGCIFDRQLSWERKYLAQAASRGCLIFWLPCESKAEPRMDGLPYAMDTRGELGEWRGHLMHNKNLHVVVGAEFNFPGLSQIKRNFDEALNFPFTIYPSMQETVDAAIRMTVW